MSEPPITIRAQYSSFTSGDNANPTRVVIHATCPSVGYPKASAPGAAHGTALYFASGNAGGSAHYVCGVDGEEHCVPDNTIAYHAPPNPKSIGIEITAEGGQYALNYTRDQWLSPQVWPAVQKAAARTRDLCDRYGIPTVKLSSADLLAGKHGICGHVDVSQAWKQSTHSDPGPSFPWPEFMQLVTQGADMPLTDAEKTELVTRTADAIINRIIQGTAANGMQLWQVVNRTDLSAIQARDAATGANQRTGDILAAINTQVVPKLGQSGSVSVDPAALAAALLADESSVAKLGDAIAAGLAKRVGNG